jgi:D-psicose/D-tagatose/L-ribulose 3-epimerase
MWKTSVVVAPETAVNAPAPLKGSLEDTIGRASAIGFDAVQFTINRPSEFDLETALAEMRIHRMKASAIATGGAYSIDGISLGHKDEARRCAAVARMKEHIDLAGELGGADVVIGLIRGTYADCDSRDQYMGQYRNSLHECIAYAESRRIRIVHEAIGRLDSDVLKTIRENIVFINEFASPQFRLQLDTHHMDLEETDFYGAVLEADGLVAQVDISDVKRTPPDGKHFDFPKLIDALKKIDFRDHLVFEFKTAGNGIAEATAGLRYIQSLY